MCMRLVRILACLLALGATDLPGQDASPPSKEAQKRFADGQRRENQGQPEQAIEDYTAAIRLASGYAAALTHRGKLYFDLGEKQKALQDLNSAIRLQPGDPQALSLRGNIYRALGQLSEAAGDWQQAAGLGLKAPAVFNSLGSAFKDLGEPRKAID